MNWLFLRGLTREQRHWGDFVRVFEATLPGAKVHCLDLPGTGTEILRDSPISVNEIMEDLRLRWSELRTKNPGPWGLLALSLGGMVGMEWVSVYPEDFQNIVLVSASAGNLSFPWERLRPGIFPKLAAVSRIRESYARERAILNLTTSLLKDPDKIAGEWAAFAADSSRLTSAFFRQITAAIRFRAPERLPIPALLLASTQDAFTAPSCSLKLAGRFQAPLSYHHSAGHDVTVDDPKWVSLEVSGWLAALAAETASATSAVS